MPQVRTLSLFLWRDLRGRFACWHRIASHSVLEPRRREDESQAGRFGPDVLQTYPCILWDKHKATGMEVALLIAKPNASISAVEQQDFVLDQMPMLRYRCSRGKHLRPRHEVLRSIVFRAD